MSQITNISDLYVDVLRHPSSPRTYRQLKEYYKSKKQHHEADAFTFLLQDHFGELPEWGWRRYESAENIHPCPDAEQREDDS